MLDINFTLIIQFANFLILMFLLNTLLFKPILAIMARRRETIDQTLADASSADDAAGETLRRYQEALAEARQASDARFAKAQVSAGEHRRERLAEAERQATEAVAQAAGSIRRATEEARADLRDQALSLAQDITERVLGRAV